MRREGSRGVWMKVKKLQARSCQKKTINEFGGEGYERGGQGEREM